MSDQQNSFRIDAVYDPAQLAAFKKMLSPQQARRATALGLRRALVAIQRHHKLVEFIRGGNAGGSGAERMSALADPRGGRKSDPTRVTWRTGSLAQAYKIDHEKDALVGAYGATAPLDPNTGLPQHGRAAKLEIGGRIVPKNRQSLAIPTAFARVGRGGAIWPSAYPRGMLYRQRKKGGGFGDVLFIKAGAWSKQHSSTRTDTNRASRAKAAASAQRRYGNPAKAAGMPGIPMFILRRSVKLPKREMLKRTMFAQGDNVAVLMLNGIVGAMDGRTQGAGDE
jgi:hypothetical protein